MGIDEVRSQLAERLRERRPEIEDAALTRIRSVSAGVEDSDPDYLEGLRTAVSAAIDYGIEGVERSGNRIPAVPTPLLGQARLAARYGVSLETVLRRYLAGYTLFGDFLIEESERSGFHDSALLRQLLRTQAALLDRLLTSVSEEYARERQEQLRSSGQRRLDVVRKLLAGELVDMGELDYVFDAWHLGIVATGKGCTAAVKALGRELGCRVLTIRQGREAVWSWLGGDRRFDAEELERLLNGCREGTQVFALGEPARGLAGWRLTHRQAKAAMSVAAQEPKGCIRYADVSLYASTLQDELLATSLRELFIAPLESERDGGQQALMTLQAYFASSRNVSSAAASLRVSRQTVTARLRAIEERLGRPLESCGAELEIALRLAEQSDDMPDFTVRQKA